MFSVFIQRALQDFSPVLENLLYPLKEVSFIFFAFRSNNDWKACSTSVCIPMAQLASLTHREAYFSQKGKSTRREAILSWWLWLPGSWPAYGVRGRSCWLPSGWLGTAWQGLTGCSYAATSGLSDNLAGRSGARSRAAICSLPQPSCPQQPYFFSLQAGAPSLYLCVRVHARLSLW